MSWRPIPHADGYEMSESGDVRRADGLLVPYYRLLWGGVTRSCRRKRSIVWLLTISSPCVPTVRASTKGGLRPRSALSKGSGVKTTSSAPDLRRSALISEDQDDGEER